MMSGGDWRAERAARRGLTARLALSKGHDGERRALALLLLKGWRPLARRHGGKGGEIDLILKRGDMVIFVEVKARARLDDALTAVTPEKQRLIRRQALRWRSENPWAAGLTFRADAVFIGAGGWPRHVPDVFPLE